MSRKIVRRIAASGLSIYDSLDSCPDLLIDARDLERLLDSALRGLVLDFPIRTRSKVLKSEVCRALGYPVPERFQRTRPRFPGQNFDTFVQKANNVQIWNESIVPDRRYVLIRVNPEHHVVKVRVVTGDFLEQLDKTGTLTRKYQAKSRHPVNDSKLVSANDTEHFLKHRNNPGHQSRPRLLEIADLYDRLIRLIGKRISNLGLDQERNRGAGLHRAVADCVGATDSDSGQFPDIADQLLEVKLQTAATIDLGKNCPDSTDPLHDFPPFRHCDVRYAVFYGEVSGSSVHLQRLVLTTGAEFFSFFRRFEGAVLNRKLQIPLPDEFFGPQS